MYDLLEEMAAEYRQLPEAQADKDFVEVTVQAIRHRLGAVAAAPCLIQMAEEQHDVMCQQPIALNYICVYRLSSTAYLQLIVDVQFMA
jgi:hypothetical protein